MYYHLTQKQRIELGLLLRLGYSYRGAATVLGVSPSTVSRELQRNRRPSGMYHPRDARMFARNRRTKANALRQKLLCHGLLARIVEEKLKCKWSPEQIAGWLKESGKIARGLYVCAQTIYDWLYRFRRDLLTHLHCRKGKYRHTRDYALRKEKRAKLASVRHISKRPKHIEHRKTYGHWEGDTIHGAGKSGYIATFVERKSGYLKAILLPTTRYNGPGFADAVAEGLNGIPPKYRKTLTLDNGPEMRFPEGIERKAGISVYYANPYHSWERGTNENTNGLLRYFFPKKSSFATLTQKEIDQAVHLLNTRPRKRLDYRTPEQVFRKKW